MARVLILGGGFGGVSTAHHLTTLMPDADIVLVDRRTHFFMGFRKITAMIGREPLEAGMRPLDALSARGVTVMNASIERIDPAARAADVDGRRIEADALVVALGADVVPAAVPGLAEHGINVYDASGIEPAKMALSSMASGTLLIGIFGVPYKCAPAPYELALLANESLRERGSAATVAIFTPQPMSLPVLGKSGCESIEGRLAGQGIGFHPNSKAQSVEKDHVVLDGGGEMGFDTLFAVPPHRCPPVVVESGLAQPGGWVKVDPRTLETSVDGVYAIGDVVGIMMANGQPMPKAGAFAEKEGRVVAERIAARLGAGGSDARYDGTGACFLEIGNGEAQQVRGNFLAEPAPDVELAPPSKDNLEEKSRWERERLDTWFGASR